jgi:tetraacyldisaccharide 4'-kinase
LPLGWLHHTPGSDQRRVAAVAAIARPKRFYDALRRQGYEVVSEFTFPDHHWLTDAEVKEIEIGARRRGASAIVTTAKDAVRLERHRGVLTLPWAILPLKVSIEPGAEFESWLRQRL